MANQTARKESQSKNPPLALDGDATRNAADEDSVNDYSSAPREVVVNYEGLGTTMGSATGEDENALESGGWQGTDDATSTAPSDVAFDVPQKPMNHAIGVNGADEDPTGRAYGGGINPGEGGVTDITGKVIGESRDWEANPVDLNESSS